jgi:hypothetical protein
MPAIRLVSVAGWTGAISPSEQSVFAAELGEDWLGGAASPSIQATELFGRFAAERLACKALMT